MDTLIRLKDVLRRTTDGRSTHYAKITAGLMVAPVAIGPRARAYPEAEVAAINDARIAGKAEDDIKALVASLMAARRERVRTEALK